jgi:hypothetical protein
VSDLQVPGWGIPGWLGLAEVADPPPREEGVNGAEIRQRLSKIPGNRLHQYTSTTPSVHQYVRSQRRVDLEEQYPRRIGAR